MSFFTSLKPAMGHSYHGSDIWECSVVTVSPEKLLHNKVQVWLGKWSPGLLLMTKDSLKLDKEWFLLWCVSMEDVSEYCGFWKHTAIARHLEIRDFLRFFPLTPTFSLSVISLADELKIKILLLKRIYCTSVSKFRNIEIIFFEDLQRHPLVLTQTNVSSVLYNLYNYNIVILLLFIFPLLLLKTIALHLDHQIGVTHNTM